MKSVTGYLGPIGTFTEVAARQLQEDSRLVPYGRIPDIFRDIESGQIDSGVVPTSNTVGGSVQDTVAAIFNFKNVRILGERILHIEHFLMSKGSFSQIKVVMSHPNAISQCRNSLRNLLPDAKLEVVNSTAEGAERAAGNPDIGVVGSSRLAEIYGLEIHPENVTDSLENYTRFLNVGKYEVPVSHANKVTVSIELLGSARMGLDSFKGTIATLGLDVVWIEPAPANEGPAGKEYILDMTTIDGSAFTEEIIDSLTEQWPKLNIRGLYVKDKMPGSSKIH